MVQVKALPHNIDAEIAILGGCLLAPNIRRVSSIIGPDDFYPDKHKFIFEAMQGLDSAGIQIDLITLRDHLNKSGHLKQVTEDYLGSIMEAVSTSAGWQYHAELIKKASISRAIIRQCQDSADALQSKFEEPETVISTLKNSLRNISLNEKEDYSNLKLYGSIYDEIGQPDDGYEPGYTTGIGNLDNVFHFEPGYINCIGAEPNIGKSPLMIQIADHIAGKYGTTLYFSLESTRKMLAQRIYARRSHIHLTRMHTRHIHPDEFEKLSKCADKLINSNLILIDNSKYLYVEALVNYVETVAMQTDVKFIIVDFLQYQYTTSRQNSRHHEISYILSKYKALAKELNIPLLFASQLDKAMQKRDDRRPRAGDLKESGDIITMTDNVLGLYAPEKCDNVGKLPIYQVEVFTIKSKEQEPFSAWLNFNGHFQEFSDGERPLYTGTKTRKKGVEI